MGVQHHQVGHVRQDFSGDAQAAGGGHHFVRGNQLVVGGARHQAGTAGRWLTGNRLIIDRSKIARMDSG